MSLGNSKCAAHPGPIALRGLQKHVGCGPTVHSTALQLGIPEMGSELGLRGSAAVQPRAGAGGLCAQSQTRPVPGLHPRPYSGGNGSLS